MLFLQKCFENIIISHQRSTDCELYRENLRVLLFINNGIETMLGNSICDYETYIGIDVFYLKINHRRCK